MNVQEAICYLKEQDLATMSVGKYEVDEDFYFMVQEYKTKEPDTCCLETHQRYTDIQWMISGEEAIDTVSVAGLKEKVTYDADKDVAFWEEPKEMCHTVLTAGAYAVLPPSIAHKPGMRTDRNGCMVKKCVGKVRVH
jgi:YhcH/YjgK/YiaL family protein